MKCWASVQAVAESWATNKIRENKRADELAELTHRSSCGAILLESRRELLAYDEYKKYKTIPEAIIQPIPEATQAQGNT